MAKNVRESQPSNAFDPELLRRFDKEITRHEDEIASKLGEFRAYKKDRDGMIAQVLDRAKDHGIPKDLFKKLRKERKHRRNADAIRAGLDGEEGETYDMLKDALGGLADTPLGQAAMAAAPKPHDNGAETLRSLRPVG